MTERYSEWFGELDLGENPPRAVEAVMAQLVEMLDQVQPESLDRDRSSIRATGHGWLMENSVVAHLAHESDPKSDIELVVSEKEAIISWATAHEHVLPEDGDRQRPWTTVVIDAVAAILRGDYLIEEHWRGQRLVTVHIIDTAGTEERLISTTGSLLSWLPGRRPDRVERRCVSFASRS